MLRQNSVQLGVHSLLRIPALANMDQATIEDAVSPVDKYILCIILSKCSHLKDVIIIRYCFFISFSFILSLFLLFFCAHTAIAVSSSLRVECLAEQDMVWQIQWPSAAPGSTQSVRCPGDGDAIGSGLAHRTCLSGGIWGPVDATACESAAIREVRIKVLINSYSLLQMFIKYIPTIDIQQLKSFAKFPSFSHIISIFIALKLQAKSLLAALNQTINDGLPILDADRPKVERLSVKLRDALNDSTIKNNRSVFPRDLEAATNVVEFVAKLVCLSYYWLAVNIFIAPCILHNYSYLPSVTYV